MEQLVATGLPIIEDCCTTFFSQDDSGTLGQYGDFSVYSFPKLIPMQIGGLLVSNKNRASEFSSLVKDTEKQHIENVVSFYLRQEKSILEIRASHYDYAVRLFSTLGFTPRFEKSEKSIPSVLLLNNHGIISDLHQLKVFLYEHGIQNSVFYGEDAFFIPIHQNLTTADLDYFFAMIRCFIEK
jgi:hypothetical protein